MIGMLYFFAIFICGKKGRNSKPVAFSARAFDPLWDVRYERFLDYGCVFHLDGFFFGVLFVFASSSSSSSSSFERLPEATAQCSQAISEG